MEPLRPTSTTTISCCHVAACYPDTCVATAENRIWNPVLEDTYIRRLGLAKLVGSRNLFGEATKHETA
jgi:hypothetical protein